MTFSVSIWSAITLRASTSGRPGRPILPQKKRRKNGATQNWELHARGRALINDRKEAGYPAMGLK